MDVLTTESYLCNPESKHSQLMSMFAKPCLECVSNVASIGSLVQEKFDDYSLTMLQPKSVLNRFSGAKWENDYDLSRILETNLIHFTCRRVHPLQIILREIRVPGLKAGG
jgi:hypothetical protein